MNEQEQFLSDLTNDQPRKVDLLNDPIVPDAPAKEEEGEDDGHGATGATGAAGDNDDGDFDIESPKNRRERRLLQKLREERESASFLAGKLEARSEAQKAVTEEADYLKSIERIYGTETPEAQIATDLLKKAVIGARDDAKAQALAEMRAERTQELQAVSAADDELDGFIDDIEETYGVRLNDAQEKGYFQLLTKMSPKDRDGNVVEYADPHAVWKVYQDRVKSKGTAPNRAKELSSRSMTQSGASKESTLKDDAATRFLKDAGII